MAFQRNFGSWHWSSVFRTIRDLLTHSSNAISWYKIMGDDRKWLHLPDLQSLNFCSGSFCPIDGILITFPIIVIMHFLRNRVIIMGGFLHLDLHHLEERLNIPSPIFVKYIYIYIYIFKLFPLVRNWRVSHQLWHYRKTTRVSLNCSKVTLTHQTNPMAICCAPRFPNAFSNTGLTVSQWYVPSVSLSSWSWWRIIFVTFFWYLYRESSCAHKIGVKNTQLSSVRKNDSLLKERTTVRIAEIFAQASLLPYRLVIGWAQVSLMLLDSTSPTQSLLPSDFWRLWVTVCWVWAHFCGHEFHPQNAAPLVITT